MDTGKRVRAGANVRVIPDAKSARPSRTATRDFARPDELARLPEPPGAEHLILVSGEYLPSRKKRLVVPAARTVKTAECARITQAAECARITQAAECARITQAAERVRAVAHRLWNNVLRRIQYNNLAMAACDRGNDSAFRAITGASLIAKRAQEELDGAFCDEDAAFRGTDEQEVTKEDIELVGRQRDVLRDVVVALKEMMAVAMAIRGRRPSARLIQEERDAARFANGKEDPWVQAVTPYCAKNKTTIRIRPRASK